MVILSLASFELIFDLIIYDPLKISADVKTRYFLLFDRFFNTFKQVKLIN